MQEKEEKYFTSNYKTDDDVVNDVASFRVADLMEEHQEELAAIESIDSGAVYTLALKTHVGMSIQTFRFEK